MVASDLPLVAALNDAAVPAVNALGLAGLREHLPMCDVALTALQDGVVTGFALALGPGRPYASENYRWFQENWAPSLYLDRIVVVPTAHRRGVGRALHEAVAAHAVASGLTDVTCEVNLEPPNPGSVAFHARLGFAEVGRLETKGGTVTVVLLARRVP